jgi:phosphoserine phosphatase
VIYVARHGETNWNREGRYQGRRDSHLTLTGVAQADALAQTLATKRVARIIASPLARCVETAQPLASALGLRLETDADLMEIAHGTWEGRLKAEVERDEPLLMETWRERPDLAQFKGGESTADVQRRWRAFVARLADADDTVIVTHDVIVRLAILDALQKPLARLWDAYVTNGAYARFRGGGSWELLDACVDAHLGDLVVDTAAQAL